jgi:hypothetical protein
MIFKVFLVSIPHNFKFIWSLVEYDTTKNLKQLNKELAKNP